MRTSGKVSGCYLRACDRLKRRGRDARTCSRSRCGLRRRAAAAATRGGTPLRRPRPHRARHRRFLGSLRRSRVVSGAVRVRARVRVLHGRARPSPGLSGPERPYAGSGGALERPSRPIRPPRSGRGSNRGGQALPRPGCPRDQAPPARPEVPSERRAAHAGLLAGCRAPCPHPHPWRTGSAADRRPPLASRRGLPGSAAHHRARRTPRTGRERLTQPITFARIHHYLAMATPLLWTRQPDTIGVLGLAINACAERDGLVEERERIAELLSCARALWRVTAEADEEERAELSRLTFRLLHIADIYTATTVA